MDPDSFDTDLTIAALKTTAVSDSSMAGPAGGPLTSPSGDPPASAGSADVSVPSRIQIAATTRR